MEGHTLIKKFRSNSTPYSPIDQFRDLLITISGHSDIFLYFSSLSGKEVHQHLDKIRCR